MSAAAAPAIAPAPAPAITPAVGFDPLELLRRSPLASQSPLAIAVNIVVFLGFLLVAAAVIADFRAYYRQDRGVVRGARSFVETGSMTAFFLVYYLVIRLRLLEMALGGPLRLSMVVFGLALIVVGAVFNAYGRVLLGSNWANQIKIYDGHTLVTGGPYSVVRHPLYASLIWIFVGGSLVYANPLALVLALGVFVPMMYVRARKEDALLAESFGSEYEHYRTRTGMFFPRLRGLMWRTS